MWNPVQYLTFADHRGRPYGELLARIATDSPRRVVDIGCGPGNLTAELKHRWPAAQVEAFDSSPEMVQEAQQRGLHATVADASTWMPTSDIDVIISNATLQWIPQHRELLTRWAHALKPGAWLAFQVPGNFDAPSHRSIRQLAQSDRWRNLLAPANLRGSDTVDEPGAYAARLLDAGCRVDAWETTYLHELHGSDPVLEWVTGTALTPVRDVLSDTQWDEFCAELAPVLRAAYPPDDSGRTWFEFRRIFVVAQIAGQS